MVNTYELRIMSMKMKINLLRKQGHKKRLESCRAQADGLVYSLFLRQKKHFL